MKALVILSPGFAANEQDTTCIPPQQVFVRALTRTHPGLKVIILSFQYPFVKSHYQWFGAEVYSFGRKDSAGIARLITWLLVWRKLFKLKRQYQDISVLSFWLGECALVGSYFARLTKVRHLTWLWGQDAKPGNRYYNRIKPKADSLIALSDNLSNIFYRNYGFRPAYTIPTGVDTGLFSDDKPLRDIDIIGAGSLIPLKQYDVFIGVIIRISLAFPDVKAVICGKGPEEERLKLLIAEHRLQNQITLKGEVPHHEVAGLMQRSRIFLHTSSYEGFGVVLAEALYAGAHVVSFTKPMDGEIRHFYHAEDAGHMATILTSLLRQQLDHERVLLHPDTEVAEQIYRLFA